MSSYFIDVIDEKTRSRNWGDLKPCPIQAEFDRATKKIMCGGAAVETGVVIVHRSAALKVLKDLRTLGQCQDSLAIIVVSGSTQNEGEVVKGRLYYRRSPVSAPKDEVFWACWKTFMSEFEKKNIRFDLLEPRVLPTLWALDILCQGYRLTHNDKELPGIDRVASGILEMAESKASATESAAWWMKGLGVSSLEQLEERLSKEVSQKVACDLVGKLRKARRNPNDAIRDLHNTVLKAMKP